MSPAISRLAPLASTRSVICIHCPRSTIEASSTTNRVERSSWARPSGAGLPEEFRSSFRKDGHAKSFSSMISRKRRTKRVGIASRTDSESCLPEPSTTTTGFRYPGITYGCPLSSSSTKCVETTQSRNDPTNFFDDKCLVTF